ncbi:hypothetical protein SDC9_164901 [bioreactor metagenome]|uniref:Uncharacterized protein n=1 Tax=bioreactor metagenome TaxID=1076179 RepID=A0A645FSW9_9ZZZZ
MSAIRHLDLRAQSESLKIARHTLCPLRIQFKCCQFDIGSLENMRSLATRRSTGIQHPQTILQIQALRCLLRTRILNRHPTLFKAGNPAHRHRPLDPDRISRQGPGIDPRLPQTVEHGLNRRLASIDPQRHRRMQIPGGQHSLPPIRQIALQARNPPCRMRVTCLWLVLTPGSQRRSFAQYVAQHAIHHALEPRHVDSNGLHRLVNNGMGLLGPGLQALYCQQQQGMHLDRWRFV